MENIQSGPSAELTRRQILNNHIVLMRKCIRQARVQVINKLTKEVRRLQERKGEAKVIEKCKRKATRLLQEIAIIKHLKEDRVSIEALQDKSSSSSLAQILQSADTTCEDRCLARLKHHPVVQAQVKVYQEQNPLWELQIPVLLEKSNAKLKKKSKKLNQDDKNKQEIVIKHRGKGEGEGKDRVQDQQGIEAESIEDETNLPVSDSTSSDTDNESESTIESIKNIPECKVAQKKKHSTDSVARNLDKTEGTIKIKQLSEDLSELVAEFTEKPLARKETHEKNRGIELESSRRRPKSSFFIGGVDAQQEPETEKETNVKQNFKPKSRADVEKTPLFKKGKIINQAKTKHSVPRQIERSAISSISAQGKPKSNRQDSQEDTRSLDTTSKLHPSWAAKKRLQASAINIEYKGKKIKFDDNE